MKFTLFRLQFLQRQRNAIVFEQSNKKDYTAITKLLLRATKAGTGYFTIKQITSLVLGNYWRPGSENIHARQQACINICKEECLRIPLFTITFFNREFHSLLEVVLKDFFFQLLEEKMIEAANMSKKTDVLSIAFQTISITPLGDNFLANGSTIFLRTPPDLFIRKQYLLQRQSLLVSELTTFSVKVTFDEILNWTKNDGSLGDEEFVETITLAHGSPLIYWHTQMKRLRQQGNTSIFRNYQYWLRDILIWRAQKAASLDVLPHIVLPESTAKSIIFRRVVQDLDKWVGILPSVVEELVHVMETKRDEYFPTNPSIVEAGHPMIIPVGMFSPNTWEKLPLLSPELTCGKVGYEFTQGKSLSLIASQRGVSTTTVVGNLLDAMLYGIPLRMDRLVQESKINPPNSVEWELIEYAAQVIGINPSEQQKFKMESLLQHIPPAVPNLRPTKMATDNRTSEQMEEESRWYKLLRWWSTLRRINYQPHFAVPVLSRSIASSGSASASASSSSSSSSSSSAL